MIFTGGNAAKIADGTKTETRRVWKSPHVKVGGVYSVRTTRFGKTDPNATRYRVTSIHTELLREIDEASARREGCESLADFIDLWMKLHGGVWNPYLPVTVVRFEVVR